MTERRWFHDDPYPAGKPLYGIERLMHRPRQPTLWERLLARAKPLLVPVFGWTLGICYLINHFVIKIW